MGLFNFFSNRRDAIIEKYLTAMIESGTRTLELRNIYYEATLKYCQDHGGSGDINSCSCHYLYNKKNYFIVFVDHTNLDKTITVSVTTPEDSERMLKDALGL